MPVDILLLTHPSNLFPAQIKLSATGRERERKKKKKKKEINSHKLKQELLIIVNSITPPVLPSVHAQRQLDWIDGHGMRWGDMGRGCSDKARHNRLDQTEA